MPTPAARRLHGAAPARGPRGARADLRGGAAALTPEARGPPQHRPHPTPRRDRGAAAPRRVSAPGPGARHQPAAFLPPQAKGPRRRAGPGRAASACPTAGPPRRRGRGVTAPRAALPHQPDQELEGPREDEVVAADGPAPAEHHQPRHPAGRAAAVPSGAPASAGPSPAAGAAAGRTALPGAGRASRERDVMTHHAAPQTALRTRPSPPLARTAGRGGAVRPRACAERRRGGGRAAPAPPGGRAQAAPQPRDGPAGSLPPSAAPAGPSRGAHCGGAAIYRSRQRRGRAAPRLQPAPGARAWHRDRAPLRRTGHTTGSAAPRPQQLSRHICN